MADVADGVSAEFAFGAAVDEAGGGDDVVGVELRPAEPVAHAATSKATPTGMVGATPAGLVREGD